MFCLMLGAVFKTLQSIEIKLGVGFRCLQYTPCSAPRPMEANIESSDI